MGSTVRVERHGMTWQSFPCVVPEVPVDDDLIATAAPRDLGFGKSVRAIGQAGDATTSKVRGIS